MSLKLSMPTPIGVDAEYHKVKRVSLTDTTVHFTILSYPTLEAKDTNKSPIDSHEFTMPYEVHSIDIKKLCYQYAKTTEKFLEATNC